MIPETKKAPVQEHRSFQISLRTPQKVKEIMFMKIEQSDQFIKASEFISRCDRLGFLYRINAFGQVCFDEGKDWSAFRIVWNKFEHPSAKVLKAVLASMGRVDKPFEAPEGPFISIDPMTGLVIGELEGAAV